MLGMITFFSASTVPFEESFTLYVPFPTALGLLLRFITMISDDYMTIGLHVMKGFLAFVASVLLAPYYSPAPMR